MSLVLKSFVLYLFFIGHRYILCGVSTTRIFNGEKVSAKTVSFQTLIIGVTNRNEIKQCGGVIFDRNTILSAAHCFRNVDKRKIAIYEGIDYFPAAPSKLNFNVKRVMLHPNYEDRGSYSHDLAIVCLEKRLTFSDRVKSIGLAHKEPEAGSKAAISGWGKTNRKDVVDIQLSHANVTLRERDFCEKHYKDFDFTQLCTFDPDTRNSVCKGDSGSPLVQNDRLIGVGSFTSSRYCEGNSIGYFVNIAQFRTFIEKNKCT